MADDLLREILTDGQPDPPRRPRSEHPSGWEPGAEFDGKRLEVTSSPTFDAVDWAGEFDARGLDHGQWQLAGPVQFRYWDAAVGDGETRQMRYFKASFLPKRDNLLDAEEVDLLAADITRHVVRPPQTADGPDAFIVCIADWQIGKSDGDGTRGTVKRILDAVDAVAARIEQVKPQRLVVASLGDLVESCTGHYSMQEWGTELDRRDQVKVLRRLLVKALTSWVPLVPSTVVAAAAGNHGEHRANGKAFTTFADNDDLAVWEQVQEIVDGSDYAERLGWVIPTGPELCATVDVAGTIVGLAHGHQAKTSGPPREKLWKWWQGQMAGRTPMGDAELLLTGHFHHVSVWEPTAGRTHIQAPAMDGGSDWWRLQTGMTSPPGMLTVVLDEGRWRSLDVL